MCTFYFVDIYTDGGNVIVGAATWARNSVSVFFTPVHSLGNKKQISFNEVLDKQVKHMNFIKCPPRRRCLFLFIYLFSMNFIFESLCLSTRPWGGAGSPRPAVCTELPGSSGRKLPRAGAAPAPQDATFTWRNRPQTRPAVQTRKINELVSSKTADSVGY